MVKWSLPQGFKHSSIYTNRSLRYITLTNWKLKTIWSSQYIQRKLFKIFHKITMKYPFMVKKKKKNSPECRHRRRILPQHKGLATKPWPWLCSMVKNWKHFFKIRNKTRVPTIIQHSFRSPDHSNQTIKRNKRNPGLQRRRKVLTVADDMILNTENPKNATRELLELTNEYSKVEVYKINT